ncbi:hypothetical protein ACH4YO_41690 [Streptomyces noursei]|uniref:hypothetical protein n=1 Tax=Streptomyces noursei TaxID=1971 RepID=UPI00081C675F|nr:hypothetical protein SNOUR_00200 [Streptomyces noursei ATCC 11455]ANZ21972.1 hypothetical protein SNOUR_43750 [Streptomyces noursei ATCC 11455]MCZ0996445.1 hypothetical protein [Streptomyces noursei]
MALAVRMSPEVEAALGPQMALQARSIAEGTCIECREPLDSGPVNVVFGRSTVATAGSIWFAHDRCAPSRVIALNAEATAAVVQPEGGLDMTMATDIVDGTPMLVARMVMTPLTDSGTHGAEPRNILMQSLLENGFHLVTAELDAPPLGQWVAVFQPHGRNLQLIVLDPSGQRFYHGTLAKPIPGWIKSVLDVRQVLLLAGDIGGRHDDEPDQLREALAVAASNGQLAGARIACGRPTDFGLN